MPIRNREDAFEVEERIASIFAASSEDRAAAVRGLFVEVLDFNAATGQLDLRAAGRAELPDDADRIAELDGVHVLLIALNSSQTDRVSKTSVDAAARVIADQLGDDLLLVFTNPSASQLHLILPDFAGPRPTLRRMVVERDLPRRTAVQQVSNIYWSHSQQVGIRAALKAAFDVEPVTREFFAGYKRIFEAVEDSVDGFESDAENKRLFVQTLFNRLMFVYFLQRKGWLAFNGDRDYLNALWSSHLADQSASSFYTDRLEALFFAGLNNSQSIDLNAGNEVLRSRIGDPPFLNGGLFEQTDLDRREGVSVPDNAIEQILSGLFDRFNFTVMESTPFDIEVAVDPEMLGKVFEELVTGRHDSGAYYTPRPVVSFMCREALKGYLAGQDIGLDSEAIARFVDDRDPSGITPIAARRVSDALDEVKVVDPACGSGAYLLGMMQELVELQTILYSDQLRNDARSLYELKLHIIQNNLYGVDIDEFAVNIAMLRMWLSLAIDFEGSKPEPLPNLDFKVVCGDSLLGPDPSAGVVVQGALGQNTEQIRSLGRFKAEYMRASIGTDKERLKREIQELKSQIEESLGVVGVAEGAMDWRVEFAEVFAERQGFDVAIANPPYVNMVTMDEANSKYRAALRSTYSTARGGFDIFVPFMERGIQLLSSVGLMSYITPNKLLAAEYAKTLRSFLMDNTQLVSIADLSEASTFTASVYPVVIVTSKHNRAGHENSIKIFKGTDNTTATQQLRFAYSATSTVARHFDNLWSPLLAPDAQELLPLLADCDRLGNIAVVSASATVSEAYRWQEAIIDEGEWLQWRDADRYRKFIVSGNIRPYSHTWGKSPVRYIKHQYHRPIVDISNEAISERRRNQIRAEKVIISGMSKRPTCVYDQIGVAAGKSTVLVIAANAEDNAFICGLLNSNMMRRFYLVMFGSLALAGGFLRFGTPQISALPVPKTTRMQRQEIARLHDQRLGAGNEDYEKYDHLVDEAVSALFGSGS